MTILVKFWFKIRFIFILYSIDSELMDTPFLRFYITASEYKKYAASNSDLSTRVHQTFSKLYLAEITH